MPLTIDEKYKLLQRKLKAVEKYCKDQHYVTIGSEVAHACCCVPCIMKQTILDILKVGDNDTTTTND